MILLVETNFVLELAYGQEGHESCRALVDLARGNDALGLALPACCVVEAHERQTRRERERGALQRRLAAELGELSRSATYAGRLEEAGRATALLAQSAEEERRRLEATLAELYDVASVIPLDARVTREAQRLQRERGLSPPDALVYSSVLSHLGALAPPTRCRGASHCFVTRDRDFTDASIEADLEDLGCKLLFRFDAALGYARSRLS